MNQIEKCNKFAENFFSSLWKPHGIIMIVLGVILVVNSFKLKDDEDYFWVVSLIGGIVVFFWGVLTMILAYKSMPLSQLFEVLFDSSVVVKYPIF